MRTIGICILFAVAVSACIPTAAHAQFSVLYNFATVDGDPFQPFTNGMIAQGRDGNLYSGALGGVNNAGTAYKITPAGALSVLYNFASVSGDGYYPYGGLTLGSDGNFYGTTYGGGFASLGTVFKMTPTGSLSTFYTFTDGTEGALPEAPPVQGPDGNFYGTTCPACNGQAGHGAIYKVTPAGTFSVLYPFDGTHGDQPEAALLLGTDGNFYGTTAYGGLNGYGVVFRITLAGKLTVVHNFDHTRGAYPVSPLMQASDGNFYGTTLSGGTMDYGTIFRMTPTGAVTILHNMNGTTNGGSPYAGLVQATNGNFYGANNSGGAASTGCPSGCGTVFKMTPAGVFSVLHSFDVTTGQLPYGNLFQHTNGIIYGTTQLGGTGTNNACGAGNCGVLYSVNIGAAPFVSLMSPAAKVGKVVEILGQGFKGTTAVSFNGTAAKFTVGTSTYMTATVPAGATTGNVTVTTPGGMLTSNRKFRVTPQLTGFGPSSGPVGTVVTITGVSLTQTTRITFGGIVATTFTVNSDTSVSVTVPTGAASGKIVITTPGGTATSATSFIVS